MPKTSMSGSIFPDLEQEQASIPHPHRNLRKESQDSKTTEKSCKSEKIEETGG